MKKIITFAMMALLIGGFAMDAFAQPSKTKTNDNSPQKVKPEQAASASEIEDMLTQYDAAIGNCERVNNKLQQSEKRLAYYTDIEKNNTSSRRRTGTVSNRTKNSIEQLQKEIAQLKKDYTTCHRDARAKKEKLQLVKRSMTSDQSSRYSSLNNRFSTLPTPATK